MRAVIQRVCKAKVKVGDRTVGALDEPGLLVLLGVTHDDGPSRSVDGPQDLGACGSCATSGRRPTSARPMLVVSQFTLYGDARKGRRPTWNAAAPGEVSEPVYEQVCAELERLGARVERGDFGADMQVSLVNDGPVTMVLDTPADRLPGGLGCGPSGAGFAAGFVGASDAGFRSEAREVRRPCARPAQAWSPRLVGTRNGRSRRSSRDAEPRRGTRLKITPRGLPRTDCRWPRAAPSSVSRVLPLEITTNAPSATAVSTAASVTGSSGGASMMTIGPAASVDGAASASSATRAARSGWAGCHRRPGPAGPGTSGWCWTTSSAVDPAHEDVGEAGAVDERRRSRRPSGRRRSPSIRVTGWPPTARAAARLAAMVDLPSPCCGLVTTMTRGGLSTSMKARLVRSLRNASAASEGLASAGPVTAPRCRGLARVVREVAGRRDRARPR